MPVIFRYRGFEIRFWYRFEEKRRHVHAIKDDINIKIWLEPKFELGKVTGPANKSIIAEILKEVKKNEKRCNEAWNEYLGK